MCITPIMLKKETVKQAVSDTYFMQKVPCGKCVECKKQRVNSWYVRLMSEMKQCSSAHFVTMTYDDDCITHSDNGLPNLDYKDVQKFFKRLRKKQEEKIKYFLVGEYGSKTGRPHYHAIIFNVNNTSNILEEWKYGFVHIGNVTDASIYYTLKYALKKTFQPYNENDDRKPEKALMSKGLGLNYLTPDMVKHFKEDVSRPVTFLGNKKLPLPRYYRDKLFTDSEKKIRLLSMSEMLDKRYDQESDKLFPQRVKKIYADQLLKLQKTD